MQTPCPITILDTDVTPNIAPDDPPAIPPGKARIARARSLPTAKPFRLAVFFASIHYLGLLAAVAALVCVFIIPGETTILALMTAMAFSAITWLIAFLKRRTVVCPMCKGTPLINSGARVHSRARRIYPLSHGTSAIFTIMTTQKFRCMYCGSDFDLLKLQSRLPGRVPLTKTARRGRHGEWR